MNFETRFCTLCGPSAPKQVMMPANFEEKDLNADIFSARRNPDRKHFQLVRCGECGIVYSDPACDPAKLAALYHEAAVNYGSQESQIYETYAHVLDRALPRLRGRGTFLEVGGGSGFMLRYGFEQGFARQLEVEPSADAERKFNPPSPQARFIRGILDAEILKQGILKPGSVSLACFFQMLDHVPDPLEFLRNIHEALEPGGAAVCVVHNTQALSAKLLGEKSPIYDIEHTYLFNPANLSKLFQAAGFVDPEVFPVSNSYSLKYWAGLAPLPKALRKAFLPLLEKTPVGEVRIKLRAGNFGIIAMKPTAVSGGAIQ